MSEQALVHVPPQPCPAQGHQTALHRAAMVGHYDTMSALVQGGCAMDLQDRDGNTALHEVAWHGFCQCVKLLVKAGADVLIKNKAGNTALHLACQNAHSQSTRVLLLGGSRPDAKNNVGDTCLHVAARYNNLTIVKTLLGALCSVSKKNQAGDTALHVAAFLNHKKTVQLLLEAGTDGNVKNCAGKTALDKARDNNHRDVALLLARAPQVHRFLRGRTVRKRREELKAERRTQSVTRVEILPQKEQEDSSLAEEDTLSSDQLVSRTAFIRTGLHSRHRHHRRKALNAAGGSPHRQRQRHRLRELVLEEDTFRRGENDVSEYPGKNELSSYNGEIPSPLEGKAYQLYTLYRDKDGDIRQRPANGCQCKPLVSKLEGQLRATQEEMKLHVLRVQDQVSCRLGKMDRRNRHQIQVLDLLNQERVSAEKQDMLYRIDHMAARSREDADRRQAVLSRELKTLCMSQDVDLAANPQYYKLLPSPSVQSDGDLESLPLLSVVSEESSSSLATYVNVPTRHGAYNLVGAEHEYTASGKYFEVKVDRSSDDYENTAIFPLPLLSSADPFWQPPKRQDRPVTTTTAVVGLVGEGHPSSASSSQSASSDWGPTYQRRGYDWSQRKRLRERILAHRHGAGRPRDHTGTLEFFIDRPSEPTFIQERNNLHAMEVTQRFFETVSTQLERWYERKVLEARQQTEGVAREDREQLLQRIVSLEEELRQLRTNGDAESCGHRN